MSDSQSDFLSIGLWQKEQVLGNMLLLPKYKEMIALGSKRNVQPNKGTNDGIMEFTVFKSIASPLFPFTAPFNLPPRLEVLQ